MTIAIGRTSVIAVGALFLVPLFEPGEAPSGRAYGLDGDDSLAAAIARSEAVTSGRFKYKLEQKVEGPTPEYELLLSGASWKRRCVLSAADMPFIVQPDVIRLMEKYPGKYPNAGKKPKGQVEIIEVSNNKNWIEYQSCPQPDGKISYYAHVATEEKSPDKQFPPFPHMLGSFWFADTKEFVARNRKKAIHSTKAKDNNGIDVYEFPVPKLDAYKAFHGVNELTRDGGRLRIYVSAKLGGVVTKIEHVGAAGVGAVLEAGDFIKVDDIHMPRTCKLQYFTPQGPGFFAKYTFSEVKDINRDIPGKEFVIELPRGTRVADQRQKESKFFEVTGQASIPSNLKGVFAATGDQGSGPKRKK